MVNFHSINRQIEEYNRRLGMTAFKPQDRVVFKTTAENSANVAGNIPLVLRDAFTKGETLTVIRSAATFTHLEASNGARADVYTSRLKAAPTKDTSNDTTVFGIEGARAAIKRLTEAGVDPETVTLRTRSWDKEGIYFAVEVKGNAGALYHMQAVTGYLDALKPVDVEPFLVIPRVGNVPIYQFQIRPSTGQSPVFLQSPFDGSHWFNPSDIARCKGIVSYGGKRYRLGQKQFVPFVA